MTRSRVMVAMRSAAVLMTAIAPAYAGKVLPIEDSKRVALSKTTTLEADRHLWLVRGKLRVSLVDSGNQRRRSPRT